VNDITELEDRLIGVGIIGFFSCQLLELSNTFLYQDLGISVKMHP